ncbi:MAG: hypothetical protein J7604_25060 [Sporocytophaga sp.]|uniref:hypothetical protein n=1 Tax=Sporocytophaga sp. TaxID=2231183 RepID=UPI001B0614F4|nr:hypothetical protein [Sporocytophaga sp.]MBO9703502.1 hypothetical protein [Sporocytophaga sp.]
MNSLETISNKLNIISEFLAKRDIPVLNKEELKKKYEIDQADLLILFGGSILHGCELSAKAFNQGIAKRMMIVGGEGHTTDMLRNIIHSKCPEFETKGKAESDIIAYYLEKKYNIRGCLIERESTNCGNNVSNALKVLNEYGLKPKYIIIMQDSSMQMRMDAGFKKMLNDRDVEIINYAPYRARVIVKQGQLCFEDDTIEGMWNMEHYINLQMGEIPRLSDTKDGYGPNGKDYIAHVDIPEEVQEAFDYLKGENKFSVREANEKYK